MLNQVVSKTLTRPDARNRDVGERTMTATDAKRYEHTAFWIPTVLLIGCPRTPQAGAK